MVLAATPKQRPSAHHKKRLGQHHQQTKRYTNTYWPYLPMLLVIVAGMLLNFGWNTKKAVLSYATEMSPVVLLQETNNQRSQNSQNGLSLNAQLAQAAQAKANDMASRDYWSHTTPDGIEPWQFITQAGYTYTSAGENLAYGFSSSATTVTGWMNSPPHRANLLNTNYKEVGFGIANTSNFQGTGEQTIVVAMYAAPITITQPVAQSSPSTPTPQAVQPAIQTTPAAQPASDSQQNTSTEPTATSQQSDNSTQPSSKDTGAQKGRDTPSTINLPPARSVSRIDMLTSGNADWASLALSAIASICLINIAIKHGRLWRCYIRKGERLLIKHPVFDTILVAIAVFGFVLTQTTGFIH